jgi:hypothetical protein
MAQVPTIRAREPGRQRRGADWEGEVIVGRKERFCSATRCEQKLSYEEKQIPCGNEKQKNKSGFCSVMSDE